MEPAGILGILLWIAIFVVVKIGFVGMAILIQHSKALFVERASHRYESISKLQTIILGLVNGVGIPFVAILLISTEVLAIFGLALLVFYIWLALLSYTVVYRSIGVKLFGEFNNHSDLKTTLIGGVIAESAFFAPIVGQLYSLWLFMRGLSSVILAILVRD